MTKETLEIPRGYRVLGIETSCDETAVGIIKNARVESSVVVGQNDLHSDFGGVVPELASRAHTRAIWQAVEGAMAQAGIDAPAKDLDAIAVTYGPGLAGSLMVGVAASKALATAYDLPLVAVDHMEGHMFAAALESQIPLPALTLLVSGGHSQLIAVEGLGSYRFLGGTLDDAVGEAFDKVARMLGLGFPGGPEIERLANNGDENVANFPIGLRAGGLDFSFSGLKTAVLRFLEKGTGAKPEDVAAAFQKAAVESLVLKVEYALKNHGPFKSVVIGGGVAANSRLRSRIHQTCEKFAIEAVIPSKGLCTDNGAMIAAAGTYRLSVGGVVGLNLSVDPTLELVSE